MDLWRKIIKWTLNSNTNLTLSGIDLENFTENGILGVVNNCNHNQRSDHERCGCKNNDSDNHSRADCHALGKKCKKMWKDGLFQETMLFQIFW